VNTTGVEVTAGLGGFLVLFGLALAVWFLGRDVSRRLHRMRQQEQLRQQRESDEPPDRPAAPTQP
jgi:Na+-transporting methylmalonyl-CoA/oxaloacetate decarboxylase gamma subunit